MKPEIIEMRTFDVSPPKTFNKKSKKVAIKEIIMYLTEIIVILLPFIIIGLISIITENFDFNWGNFIDSGEFLWFSITTLILYLFKFVVFEHKTTFFEKCLSAFSVFLLVLSTGIYIYLKLVEIDLFELHINTGLLMWITFATIIITSFINLTPIVLNGDKQ